MPSPSTGSIGTTTGGVTATLGHIPPEEYEIKRPVKDEAANTTRGLTESGVHGLEPGEHPFLACSFWLVEQYARTGRKIEAKILMDKLVGLANELGLLREEYATNEWRIAGNFPQVFSHLTLVRVADAMHGSTASVWPSTLPFRGKASEERRSEEKPAQVSPQPRGQNKRGASRVAACSG